MTKDEIEIGGPQTLHSFCPDCAKLGAGRRVEETSAGISTLRLNNNEICHRDPNKYIDTFRCPDGHTWDIRYKVACLCSRCGSPHR